MANLLKHKSMFWDLSWSDRLLVSQTMGSATGILMVLLFVLLLSRAPRHYLNFRHLGLLIACGFCWNLSGLFLSILGHVWNNEPAHHGAQLHLVALSTISAAILPPGLVILWRPRLRDSWLSKPWLLWVTTLVSAILTPFCLFSLYGWIPSVPFNPMEWMTYHIAVTAIAGAVAFLRGPSPSPSTVVYSLATAGGACLMAIVGPANRFLHPTPENYFWMTLCKQDGGLLMILGCFFLFGTFRFAHVFVKQGLRILFAAIAAPVLWVILAAAHSEGAKGFLLPSAILAVVLLLFPLVDRLINLLVDRWLLRHPDYATVIRRTWDGINPLDSEDEILRTVSAAVCSTLALEECRIISAEKVTTIGGFALTEGEIRELCDNTAGIHVLVPVRCGSDIRWAMALRQHSCHTNLLSVEIHFLLTMASQLGSRLEALQFEQERLERQKREARLHSEIIQAELKALRAQINPHFLFNSLNAIAELIVADPQRAEEMTLRLAKVFRYVLRNSDRQLASVQEEMEFLRSYLGIEEARFGGRLRISFHVDQDVQPDPIPSLLLQPLVENAIKHGLAPKVGQGHLAISARREGAFLRLAVEDDGLGPPPKPALESYKRPSSGLGLRNVADRLKTLYNGRADMSFEGEPMRGSRVTILIPRET